MNHEGHEVTRRYDFCGFPSCTLVTFVVRIERCPGSKMSVMEKKIFWISFTMFGLAADFVLPHLVGAGSDDSDRLRELVDRLSQRLVLKYSF